MGLVRNRGALAAAAVAGVIALFAIGFWVGRSYQERTAPAELHGTVVAVGGDPGGSVEEFAVDIDGSDGPPSSYGIGSVPWTDETVDLHETDTPPPCIAIGRHITFGVAHVSHAGWTMDEVVWVDCTTV